MINDKSNEVIEAVFWSLLCRYQFGCEISMKGSEFVFNYIHVLYCKCDKINPNWVGSYIDSPNWTISKKATTNTINKKDKCFQYAVTVALNHEIIGDILKQ